MDRDMQNETCYMYINIHEFYYPYLIYIELRQEWFRPLFCQFTADSIMTALLHTSAEIFPGLDLILDLFHLLYSKLECMSSTSCLVGEITINIQIMCENIYLAHYYDICLHRLFHDNFFCLQKEDTRLLLGKLSPEIIPIMVSMTASQCSQFLFWVTQGYFPHFDLWHFILISDDIWSEVKRGHKVFQLPKFHIHIITFHIHITFIHQSSQ